MPPAEPVIPPQNETAYASAPPQNAEYTYQAPPVAPPQPNYNNQNFYQAPQSGRLPAGSKEKLPAGLLAIFLGGLGIHKFYLGYTKAGVIMLLVSLLTFGIGATIMSIIGLIEGILYLTKTDDDFNQLYVLGNKEWF